MGMFIVSIEVLVQKLYGVRCLVILYILYMFESFFKYIYFLDVEFLEVGSLEFVWKF